MHAAIVARKIPISKITLHPKSDLWANSQDGVVNILEHTELSVVARMRALMNFTAFWLVLIQHGRANAYLGGQPSFIVTDCGATHPQLRRVSQRSFKDLQQAIVEASEKEAGGEQWAKQGKNRIRGFFWATAATTRT